MKNVDAPATDKQKLIGHAKFEMTAHYTHTDIASLKKITDNLWFLSGSSIGHSKIIRFLWPPCDPQNNQKPSNTNNFSLYGIQEVTGSIPVISTKKVPRIQ